MIDVFILGSGQMIVSVQSAPGMNVVQGQKKERRMTMKMKNKFIVSSDWSDWSTEGHERPSSSK